MKRKATTADIASELGLSRTTVSKALNGHPAVPAATRQKVLETAARLRYKHYRPDALEAAGARPQAGPGMRTIACLIRSGFASNKGYWVDVLQGVEEASRQNGCNMVLHFITAEDLDNLQLPRSLTETDIDGVILAGLTRKLYIEAVAGLGIPAVLIDSSPDVSVQDAPFDTVLMESERSVYALAGHLIGLGHRRIGFVGDVGDCLSFAERWNGFRRAMLDAGLPIDPNVCAVAPAADRYFDADETARAIAAMRRLPTAFVCANDLVALRVIQALDGMGLRVPDDVSVTGFDLIGLDAPGRRLTSARVEAVRIGSRACEQLLRRMAQPDAPAEQIRLATRVARGDTTAAAPLPER